MKVWVAVDIGCIECGEQSKVLGVFKHKSDAEKVSNSAEKEQGMDWHGQHIFFIQEVEIK